MAPHTSTSAVAIVENLQELITPGQQASSNMTQYLKDIGTLREEPANDLVTIKSRLRHLEKSEDDMAICLGKKTAELERVTEAAKEDAKRALIREEKLKHTIAMMDRELKEIREHTSETPSNTDTQTRSTAAEEAKRAFAQEPLRQNLATLEHERLTDRIPPGTHTRIVSGRLPSTSTSIERCTDTSRARKRPKFCRVIVPTLSTGRTPSTVLEATASRANRSVGEDDGEAMADSNVPSQADPPCHTVQSRGGPAVLVVIEPDLKKLFVNLDQNMQQVWRQVVLAGNGWSRIGIEKTINLMAGYEAGKRLDTKPFRTLDRCATRSKTKPTMYQRCLRQDFEGSYKPYSNLQRTDQGRACQSCIMKRIGPCVYVKFVEDAGRCSYLGCLDKEKTPLIDFASCEQIASTISNSTRWELIKRKDSVTVSRDEIGLARDAAVLMVL